LKGDFVKNARKVKMKLYRDTPARRSVKSYTPEEAEKIGREWAEGIEPASIKMTILVCAGFLVTIVVLAFLIVMLASAL
jgi:hypothetical protein